jgi:hypothetical protein
LIFCDAQLQSSPFEQLWAAIRPIFNVPIIEVMLSKFILLLFIQLSAQKGFVILQIRNHEFFINYHLKFVIEVIRCVLNFINNSRFASHHTTLLVMTFDKSFILFSFKLSQSQSRISFEYFREKAMLSAFIVCS